jgi:hypothetical protein
MGSVIFCEGREVFFCRIKRSLQGRSVHLGYLVGGGGTQRLQLVGARCPETARGPLMAQYLAGGFDHEPRFGEASDGFQSVF